MTLSLAGIVALGPAAIDMYLASMPNMALDLQTSYASTQMTLTTFLIFMGLGQLIFGPLSDAIGRRIPLLLGLITYMLTSLWAAFSPSLESLMLARLMQGLGAAMMIVVVMSMVRDLVEGTEAAQLYALLNTIVALGPIIAPALGGFIGAHYGWRGIMLVLTGLSAFILMNTLLHVKESLVPTQRIAFHFNQICHTYFNILKNHVFLLILLALSAVYFFLFSYIGGSAYVYQNDYQLSLEQFGLVFGLTSISLVLGASSSAYWVKKIDISHLAILGAIMMMLGSLLCLLTHFFAFGLIGIVSGIALGLFGLGILEASLMAIAMDAQKTALGSSAALLGAVPMLLSSIATPIAGRLVEINSFYWLLLLSSIGPLILIFVYCSAKKATSIKVLETH